MHRFPTAGELAEGLGGRTYGMSRRGEPLLVTTIGTGERNALVFAGPHPDEPVGFLTIRALARVLTGEPARRAGMRWHLVPCVDPDGARLNEGWYAHPGDRAAYGRHHYRPAFAEQVEWTFGDPMPETAALAALIDELRPALMCSLHNGQYGGVFHYVNTDDAELAARLSEVPAKHGLPPHNAIWEAPDSAVLAPGVLRMPSVPGLVSSADYASRHGTTTVITEVPYWEDPRAGDTSPCGRNLAELVGEAMALLDETAATLKMITPEPVTDTPFHRAYQDGLRMVHGVRANWSNQVDRPATVAEQCSFEVLPHMMRIRLAGALLRVLDAERRPATEAEAVFGHWCELADRSLPGTPIPLHRLADVQVESALVAAHAVSKTA